MDNWCLLEKSNFPKWDKTVYGKSNTKNFKNKEDILWNQTDIKIKKKSKQKTY